MTEAKPSKSARKREHLALQDLGEKLVTLKDTELRSMALDEDLLAAVREAAQMKSRGALRRQKQLIGKLMRNADAERIRAALAGIAAGQLHSKRVFSVAERWRDRMVVDGELALGEFETEIGREDMELRVLLQSLAAATDDRDRKLLCRKIFRRVHAILVTGTQDS